MRFGERYRAVARTARAGLLAELMVALTPAAALLAGCVAAQRCPCGASPDDPVERHDVWFTGRHWFTTAGPTRVGDPSAAERLPDAGVR